MNTRHADSPNTIVGSLEAWRRAVLDGDDFLGVDIDEAIPRCWLRLDVNHNGNVNSAFALVTEASLLTGALTRDDHIEMVRRPLDDLILWLQTMAMMVSGSIAGSTGRATGDHDADASSRRPTIRAELNLLRLSAGSIGSSEAEAESSPPRVVSVRWMQDDAGSIEVIRDGAMDRSDVMSSTVPVTALEVGIQLGRLMESTLGVKLPRMRIDDRIGEPSMIRGRSVSIHPTVEEYSEARPVDMSARHS